MSDPTRSADKAYYASRTPLDLRGTREGRSNPPKFPSYQHKGYDSTASSDKYYAVQTAKEDAPVAQAVRQKPSRNKVAKKTELIITDTDNLLRRLSDILRDNDGEVVVKGDAELIRRARMLLDLSVGRNEFTRQQADSVSFAVIEAKITVPVVEVVDVAPEPAVEAEPEAEPEPEPEPEVIPDPVMRDEIAELLATPVPVVKKSKPKQVRQAKKPEAKTITEDDIAAALGLGDDSDD